MEVMLSGQRLRQLPLVRHLTPSSNSQCSLSTERHNARSFFSAFCQLTDPALHESNKLMLQEVETVETVEPSKFQAETSAWSEHRMNGVTISTFHHWHFPISLESADFCCSSNLSLSLSTRLRLRDGKTWLFLQKVSVLYTQSRCHQVQTQKLLAFSAL